VAEVVPAPGEVEALVRQVAREEILPRFTEVQHHIKHDGSLVTEADHATQHRLQTLFRERWPAIAFLGEEMSPHRHERLMAGDSPLWCVDPLDGTSNFATGIPFFAVSVALLRHDRPVMGVVCDPVRDECFSASPGEGAWLNGSRLGVPDATERPLRRAIACIDLKRLERSLATRLVGEQPFGSQRNFGASSLEWCWLADGRFHVYLHGGQKLWDYAAGSLVLSEAGGHASTLHGEPVFQAGLEPRSVVASLDRKLFTAWCGWLGVPVAQ
jgi:myo-inositol-1(or 4)-monophosphatase